MGYTILLMIAMMLGPATLYAQDDNNEKGNGPVTLGGGLTQKQVGNFSVITAEDADVTNTGKQAFIEDIYKYVGRKFRVIEARLNKLEEGQEEIRDRLKQIEFDLSKMKKALSQP